MGERLPQCPNDEDHGPTDQLAYRQNEIRKTLQVATEAEILLNC